MKLLLTWFTFVGAGVTSWIAITILTELVEDWLGRHRLDFFPQYDLTDEDLVTATAADLVNLGDLDE